MAEIKHHFEDGTLTVSLTGHIDSSNAAEAEKLLTELCGKYSPEAVVADCNELKYISSAGLRIMLRLKKTIQDTKIINVSSDVYEVFDMTGFTEIMDISKAFRTISVAGCEVIGQGSNGMVYRIDPDTIVKVYKSAEALPEIERERGLARTAFVLGIPTAIPYDVVRIEDGGFGSVFELLSAKSLAKLLISGEKTVDEAAKICVDLLKQIHSTEVKAGTMSDMRKTVLGWVDFIKGYLPDGQWEKIHALVEAIPADNHMMHGDFHLKNIMLQNGESLLIDMETICCGHPVFEFAGMYNAYIAYAELDHNVIYDFMGITFETACELWHKMLALYLDTDDESIIRSVEEKAMIICYTRIMRRQIRDGKLNTEKGRAEMENSKKHLAELLERVTELTF